MKNNNPNYSHYVVAKGKIESGWEYKEDAKEHVSENLPDSLKAGAKVVAKSALSRHSIDPENNDHWHTSKTIKEGKIESGHESKNEASFHHSENLPKHLKGESRVVSRDELKKGHLDPSNKDHWAKTSDLKESFVSILEEGDVFSFSDAIKESLAMKAHIVIENCDKKRLLDAARGGQISEMRDAPDQAMYPLTRREVEKLINTYERRAELDTNNNDSIEARSEDGMKRARWYAPDVRSDFKYDVEDDMFNPDTRPAALMPYDKHNVKTDDSSTDEHKKQHQDYSGESNLYFHSGGKM